MEKELTNLERVTGHSDKDTMPPTQNTAKLITENSTIGNPVAPLPLPESVPYLLFYRQGNNPNPQFFLFYYPSHEIRKVVERIKKHCELMNLRFVNVRPFVVDLNASEAKQFGTTQAGVAE